MDMRTKVILNNYILDNNTKRVCNNKMFSGIYILRIKRNGASPIHD